MLRHPCILRGPQTKGDKIRIGCLTPTFLGAQKRAKMPRHPCILGVPKQRGTKSKLAASPLPSRGPKRRHKCYVTPAFSGSPNKGGQKQSRLPHPLPSRGSPSKGGQNQKWLSHPCLLGGPKEGENAMLPLHSRESATEGDKIRSRYQKHNKDRPGVLNSTGKLGPKRGRKYVTPAFSGIPKQRGTKSKLAASPLPSRGPKRGQKCRVTPAVSRVPKQRGGGSELAASPLPSRGPKRGRKCYVTPAFSEVPNKGDKIRSQNLR